MIADSQMRGASSKVSACKALKLLPFLMVLPFATVMLVQGQSGATDPGVRGGPAGAGGPIAGLSAPETLFFYEGQARFVEIDSVLGNITGEAGVGLGPRFNMNSCAGCHAQPAIGGTSPFTNPQIAVANLDGATNTLPFFIAANGPVREARFIFNPDGTRDGGVHDLFTITGRSDAVDCNISQPDYDAANENHNLIFRIPTPVFGGGLIEAIKDSTIVANMDSHLSAKKALAISGHPNTSGNDGTITRFGWKAQNKSLELFAGEAYNVEQGVTNEIFSNERDETPGCLFNATPEDHTNFTSTILTGVPSDVVGFALFIRFLAPPTPAPATGSTIAGSHLFTQIGCALCHTPTLMTGPSSSSALNNRPVNLFSDLLVHHMGQLLGDNIMQGNAGPDEFRTAPLWGLGKRIFFLHDGRTTDLLQAIKAHTSTNSEANGVIANFNALSPTQQQNILNFLRSL